MGVRAAMLVKEASGKGRHLVEGRRVVWRRVVVAAAAGCRALRLRYKTVNGNFP